MSQTSFFHQPKGSTIDRTTDIVMSLGGFPTHKHDTAKIRDGLRLASLYGSGLGQASKLKGKRILLKGDESDFDCDESDLQSALKILSKCMYFIENGAQQLESSSSGFATVTSLMELQTLLEVELRLKLSLPELSALIKSFESLEGRGFNTQINFGKFIVGN